MWIGSGWRVNKLGAVHKPLRELVCDELRDWIVNGEIAPGERLVEESIAQKMGVSRNPVREAIRTLEWEGFVAVLPRRGAVVASLSEKEADEILEVRIALQAEAAALAARKRSDEHLERMFALLERGEAMLASGERRPSEYAELNAAFHELVLEMADNRYLADVIRPMRRRISWMFRRTDGRHLDTAWREHRLMAEAIAAGDEEVAARVAAEHILSARSRVPARTDLTSPAQ